MSLTPITQTIQPATWLQAEGDISLPLQSLAEGSNPKQAWVRSAAEIVDLALNPLVLTTVVLAAWRLGQDLDWTGNFFIQSGFFSHWQVWIAMTVSLKFAQMRLQRALPGLHQGQRRQMSHR